VECPTTACPRGNGLRCARQRFCWSDVERTTGFKPATPPWQRWCSTKLLVAASCLLRASVMPLMSRRGCVFPLVSEADGRLANQAEDARNVHGNGGCHAVWQSSFNDGRSPRRLHVQGRGTMSLPEAIEGIRPSVIQGCRPYRRPRIDRRWYCFLVGQDGFALTATSARTDRLPRVPRRSPRSVCRRRREQHGPAAWCWRDSSRFFRERRQGTSAIS
jgi:hypothetical protein